MKGPKRRPGGAAFGVGDGALVSDQVHAVVAQQVDSVVSGGVLEQVLDLPAAAQQVHETAAVETRSEVWTQRITPLSSSGPINPKIIDGMLDVLTHAA